MAESTLRLNHPILGEAGTPVKFHDTARWILEKRAILSETTAEANGKSAYMGVTVTSLDPESGRVISQWRNRGALGRSVLYRDPNNEDRLMLQINGVGGNVRNGGGIVVFERQGPDAYTSQLKGLTWAGETRPDGPIEKWKRIE